VTDVRPTASEAHAAGLRRAGQRAMNGRLAARVADELTRNKNSNLGPGLRRALRIVIDNRV